MKREAGGLGYFFCSPPVTTEPTHLDAETEIKEPVAPVTTVLTDPKAEPETGELVAPVPLTPSFHFYIYMFIQHI